MSLIEKEDRPTLEKIVEHHFYPDWLTNHPHRIRFHYQLLRLIYLRSRICRRHLMETLSSLDPGSVILDAGCGEGQFLIPAARRFPGLSFVGMDQRPAHISFLQKLADEENIFNIGLILGDIETSVITPVPVDFIFIVSVLQYTQYPDRLIQRFSDIQPLGGKLMIYTPVGPHYTFSFSRWAKRRYSHYDAAQPFHQSLNEEELLSWIGTTGYVIREKKYYYSKTAAFGHELFQTLIILLTHWPPVFKIIPLIIMLLFSPIFVSLQVVDEFFSPKRGNGLLLILQKQR